MDPHNRDRRSVCWIDATRLRCRSLFTSFILGHLSSTLLKLSATLMWFPDFLSLNLCLGRSLLHPTRGRFRCCVPHHRSGSPPCCRCTRKFVFSLLRSQISSAPRPSLSFPNLSCAVWQCPCSSILLPLRIPGPQLVSRLSFW